MKKHILIILLISLICIFALHLITINTEAAHRLGELIYSKDSLYHRIFVFRKGPIVSLVFDKRPSTSIQSQINIHYPHHLKLQYTKMVFSGLLYKPEPKNVLILGLGGGIIPKEMRHYFPDIEIDVVEIDAEIPPIAHKYFHFKTDEKLKVHIEDGRVFIKKLLLNQSPVKYDMIILDAFNGDYIPFHLMTKEFLEQVKQVLADDGAAIANVFSDNRLFDAEFKTFLEVFGNCQVYKSNRTSNAMLVSTEPAGVILTQQQAIKHAQILQEKHNFTFDLTEVAQGLEPNIKPHPQTKTLTDDQAPVNQLLQRRN